MKIGIMGGTFDPIHIGHLIAAERAKEGMGLDQVWFMPSNVPPHKTHSPGASAQQRWEMVCRAVADHPDFRPFDLELKRGGVSYTVETVKQLEQLHPDHQFYYIIGADMVQFLPKWHRIEEIVERISFIGLQRPGFTASTEQLSQFIAKKVTIVPMPMIEISSTDIRERRRRRLSVRYLVSEAVHQFIEGNGLYET